MTFIRIRALLIAMAALVFVTSPSARADTARPVIVLIGGPDQGYPKGEHDYIAGTLKIERLIKYSPELQAVNPIVKSFPLGFPKDLTQIADADVVLLYCGLDYASGKGHPLEAPENLEAMGRLMAKGAGLIALHQASTVSSKDSRIPFTDWLGAIRIGFADRTTEIAHIEIAGGTHPVARGLKAFDDLDEFYPTLKFSETTKITPILTAKVHVQYRDKARVFEEPSASHVLAWAAERPNGGRSFGFTGVHYLTTLDEPGNPRRAAERYPLDGQKRRTGGRVEFPRLAACVLGPRHPPPDGPHEVVRTVLSKAEVPVQPQSWGRLEWFASARVGQLDQYNGWPRHHLPRPIQPAASPPPIRTRCCIFCRARSFSGWETRNMK